MLGVRCPLEVRTTRGDPVRVADLTVTPVAWSLIGEWPWGGFVWTRPAALDVERDGRVERIPILDMTRIVQLVLAALALLGALGLILRRFQHARGG